MPPGSGELSVMRTHHHAKKKKKKMKIEIYANAVTHLLNKPAVEDAGREERGPAENSLNKQPEPTVPRVFKSMKTLWITSSFP